MPIKRTAVFVLLLIAFVLNSFSQDQTLTLEDAILKQRTTLSPEKVEQLSWVKGTDHFAYLSYENGESYLVIRKPGEKKAIEKMSLSWLNESLGLSKDKWIKKIPKVTWIGKNAFLFQHKGEYFACDLDKKKITSLQNRSKDRSHVDFFESGKHLAFTVENNLWVQSSGSEGTAVTSDENKDIVSGQAVHRFEFGITKGTFWSPKANYLAFYRNDQGEVTDYPLVNTETLPATLKKIKYPMAGGKSEKVQLLIYDRSDDTTHPIKTDPEFEYLTNITWGPSEKYIYIATLNRDQNHMKLNQYNAISGEFVSTLIEERHEKYVEPLHPMIFIDGHPDSFLWLSQQDGFMHLYKYSVKGELERQLTSGGWVIKKFLGSDSKGQFAYVEGTGDNPTETHLYQIDLARGTHRKITQRPGTHRGQLSTSGSYLIDEYSSITTPREVSIIDEEGKQIEVLLQAGNPLMHHTISTPELSTLKTEDGKTDLHFRLIKPSDFDAGKKYPVLVYVYNGPHVQLVQNRWLGGAPLWMYYLAEKGYIVFSLDGRGSTNRGRNFEQAVFRQLGKLELEDQLTGLNFLKKQPYVDTERLAIHGWSYGGFMTTSMMLKHPKAFKVGVAGGPVIDWKFYEVMYTERYMDTPEQNPEGYKQSSLLNYVDQLDGKLLTIHGLQDDVVVPQHNLTFIRKCIMSGVQTDFFAYPTHPHNVRGKDRIHLMHKVIDYIETHL